MTLDEGDFEVVILPGKNPPAKFLSKYNLAYQCWRETWAEALTKEMNHTGQLFSDAFTRQDEVFSLFYRGQCVGMTFFRWVHFDELSASHDSYFHHWPESSLEKLCQDGGNIIVISQFTVHPEFRKDFNGLSMRDLLIALCYERFSQSQFDAAASAVRVQKHMEQAVHKVGATTILSDVDYDFGQKVDLIAFYRRQIHESTVPGAAAFARTLFPRTISLIDSNILKTKEVKRAA